MCGIFGFVGTRERAQRLDLSSAVAALHHRGPDGNGTFRSWDAPHPVPLPIGRGWRGRAEPGEGTGPACVLASTRLAILDLSPAGAQPMSSPDGRYTIVYNGEVYNFREVREELEREELRNCAIAKFRNWMSNSDTEVILKAWIRWGEAALPRLRGMFAFAIWDDLEKKLVLVRDRLGVKPLYFAETEGGIAFASEVRSLLATGTAARRISDAGLASYLAFGSVSEPDTILDGVCMLPSGSSATIRGGSMVTKKYWDLPDPFSSATPCSRDELRETLREAVRLRLVSDVPVGVFLSGGLDSSSITALAAERSGRPLQTLTVTFDEPSLDERLFAADVAARFGCEHKEIDYSGARASADIDAAVAALDQPSADGVNTYFVARAAREAGIKVALSGVGGDELFAGYRNFRRFAKLLAAGRFFSPLLGVSALDDVFFSPRLRRALSAVAAGGEPAATSAALRRMFQPAEIRGLMARVLNHDRMPSGAQTIEPDDPVNALSRLEIRNYLRNTLLRDTDSMSMGNSVEVRAPFLDHVLIERVLSVPGREKIAGRDNKPLLSSLVPELASEQASRPKMGFVLPMESWLRGPLRKWTEDRLFGGGLDNAFRREAVENLWSAFVNRGAVSWSRVWCLAAVSDWCERNGALLGRNEHPASTSTRRTVGRQIRQRALVLAPDANSLPGGIATYTRMMIRALTDIESERGVKVDALILHDRRDSEATRGFGGSRIRFAAAFLSYAARHRPDLIVITHLNFGSLDTFLRFASPRSRFWYVLHGIEAWRRVTNRRHRALSRADRLLAVSRHTRRVFARANGIPEDRIAILPCAMESDLQRVGDQQATANGAFPTLMTVARLVGGEGFKGVDAVLRALPRLVGAFPNIHYVVVGDGDERPRLERLAIELGVADRVDFLGRVDETALAAAYAKCTLFVMPSSTEGFGIVYLEAAAFGRPSVAARGSGAEEFIVDGETGILVDPGNDEVLTRTLERYLAAPREIDALGQRARARQRERFSYLAFRSRLAELVPPVADAGAVGSAGAAKTTNGLAGQPDGGAR